MDSARPSLVVSRVMLRGGISFVFGKTIARINLVKITHEPIAGDLRQDTRGGDRVAFAIALDQRRLRVRQPLYSQAIDEHVLWSWIQLVQGNVHGAPCGLTNIDSINHFDIHGCDGETNFWMRGDDRIKLFALFFVKLL